MISAVEVPRVRKLRNMFMIAPTIFSVSENNEERAISSEYTSEGSVSSKDVLKRILEKYNIIL